MRSWGIRPGRGRFFFNWFFRQAEYAEDDIEEQVGAKGEGAHCGGECNQLSMCFQIRE